MLKSFYFNAINMTILCSCRPPMCINSYFTHIFLSAHHIRWHLFLSAQCILLEIKILEGYFEDLECLIYQL